MQEHFENHLPKRVLLGRGQIRRLGELIKQNGWKSILLASDRGIEKTGLLKPILQDLEEQQLLAGTFFDISPEPPFEDIEQLSAALVETRAEAIVAVGGGSVMDAAKVASLCAHFRKPISDFVGIGRAPGRGLGSIMIPTTSGTGSEMTYVAILTDNSTGNKVGVVDPSILADLALVDPALTDGLPKHVTAAAGMDALVHALEAYIARVATPIARGLALEALRRIGPNLRKVVETPTDTDARDQMAIGSNLAGMAFANSSCCAVHGMALPLGGRYHIPHGVLTGCFVGALVAHNAPACEEDLLAVAKALGWQCHSPEDLADSLNETARDIGLFDQLRQTTVDVRDLNQMATDAVSNRRLMDPNPQPLEHSDAVSIYKNVLGL